MWLGGETDVDDGEHGLGHGYSKQSDPCRKAGALHVNFGTSGHRYTFGCKIVSIVNSMHDSIIIVICNYQFVVRAAHGRLVISFYSIINVRP